MKKIFIAIYLVTMCAMVTSAKIWRINPNPSAKAAFTTIQEALLDDNVISGDTLMLDAGYHSAMVLTDDINKDNITVIGTGYLLDQNTDWDETQVAILAAAAFREKITNCKLEGIWITGNVQLAGENLTVSRCRVDGSISSMSGYTSRYCTVEDCLISKSIQLNNYSTIRNNLILLNSQQIGLQVIQVTDGSVIENNTIIDNVHANYIVSAQKSVIRNNIVINKMDGMNSSTKMPYATCCINMSNDLNNTITNNILSTTEEYADSYFTDNYFIGASEENIFVNEGSLDGKYRVRAEIKAYKASHGGECGAFGGTTPYVLSGIPLNMPHITSVQLPARPTDGKIVVTLSIENQNE